MADWIGISSSNYDSHCGEDVGYTLEDALDGIDSWYHSVDETHWFILDLGQTYNVTKIRGRSFTGSDPTDVNIYVSDNKEDFGVAVASGVDVLQDTTEWVEVDTTDKEGRYVKVEIVDTENVNDFVWFGSSTPFTIFDVYGEEVVNVTVEPSTLELAATLQTPTAIPLQTILPDTLELAATLNAPTVLFPLQTILPDTLELAATLQTPTAIPLQTILPDTLELAATLNAPTVISSCTVTPDTLALAMELLTSTVKFGPSILSIEASEGELGSLISRAIPRIPENPREMRRVIKKVLREHYQDIQTLFNMTTDVDKYEQQQRENE